MKHCLLFLSCLFFSFISAQSIQVPQNWFHLDSYKDGFNGVSSNKAYEMLKGKKSKTIIVAVLDSGVDADHEDLKSIMWTNPKEIPGNGIDDDHNGYIDDIHGWNFIGGKNANIEGDSYEVTRMYASLKYKYNNADPSKLTKQQKKEYESFLNAKEQVETRRENAQSNLDAIKFSEKFIKDGIEMLSGKLDGKELNIENVDKIDEGDSKSLSAGVNIAKNILSSNPEIKNIDGLKKIISDELDQAKKQYNSELNYGFNPDLDERSKIVGDHYSNVEERYYGNNDVRGPDAMHGTHVAGLIAAVRNNNIGMDGIADHVRIMSVRCVPDGDERDKDVANAIRYAVDNGASVINMSFGKGFSPNKKEVDEAVKYAASKDVLLVHAAGNNGTNNDDEVNYPNKYYAKKKFFGKNSADNWLEVGASTPYESPKQIADFSNYGKKNVDLFAPGVLMYSTVPDSQYKNLQGTSMASPVAAGVAALIRSYFPTLTAKQVRKLLLASVSKSAEKVKVPKTDELKNISDLSISGGFINARNAVSLASKTKGKKKVKDWDNSETDSTNPIKSGPKT